MRFRGRRQSAGRQAAPAVSASRLPHVRINFAGDGEILVPRRFLAGYLGRRPQTHVADFFATGDLGYLDATAICYLTGRKKNMFITSFGRNVAPEWVERELVAHPGGSLQAAIFGEGRPFNCAVIVRRAGRDQKPAQAIDAATRRRQSRPAGLCPRRHLDTAARNHSASSNGMLTANGRICAAIASWASYADQIEVVST